MSTKTLRLDLEPTWETLLRGVEHGVLELKVLDKPCKLADIIRRSQKRGAKSVTFTFPSTEGEATVTEVTE